MSRKVLSLIYELVQESISSLTILFFLPPSVLGCSQPIPPGKQVQLSCNLRSVWPLLSEMSSILKLSCLEFFSPPSWLNRDKILNSRSTVCEILAESKSSEWQSDKTSSLMWLAVFVLIRQTCRTAGSNKF